MGTLLGITCEMITGHRMGLWLPYLIPESPRARFEYSQCRWCRQKYIRPQKLEAWLDDEADRTG